MNQDDQLALRQIAQKLFWWKHPDEALANVPRFLAQVMTIGGWNDVQRVVALFGNDLCERF